MNKLRIFIWLGALVVGVVLGLCGIGAVNVSMDFIATVFTRLFRLLAVPTIALAVVTTLASLGNGRDAGRMFRTTVCYTLLTTFAAACVGLLLYVLIAPGNLPASVMSGSQGDLPDGDGTTYSEHLLSVIPDNMVRPFLEGNVLALLVICFAVGIAVMKLPSSRGKQVLLDVLDACQQVMFRLIRWLIAVLPVGIMAFAAQLAAQLDSGLGLDSLGKYVLVILGGNVTQFVIVLPLFLLAKRINPLRLLRAMTPAVLMAFFSKSSAGTLPVTMENAESRAGVSKGVSRFVLPICTTVNMNGCAAFILVTSLYVMQNNGMPVTWVTMLSWLFVSVLAAVGNAGVPMGCFFLTLSLMSGIGADVSILGVILPIYTIIDMVETGENVWSDSCVCAIVDKTHKSCNG